jgi:hypothetical protein
MATTNVSAEQNQSGPVKLIVEKPVFDLKTFDDVTLVKTVEFQPINTMDEVLTLLQNDESRIIKVINAGLREEKTREARKDDSGWHTYADDGVKINGPFDGTVANPKKVNIIVLGLAKSVFGFNKDMTREQKKAAKDKAKDFVKNNETIREGLRQNAGFDSDDDEESSEHTAE